VIFTACETVWAIHEYGEAEEESHTEEPDSDLNETILAENALPSHGTVHEEDSSSQTEAEDSHDEHSDAVCAILVKSKSFNDYYKLMEIYGANSSLLCINPSTVLREVLDQVDLTRQIVYILCAIILLMNIVVISVITLLNMYDAQKEIALMRLIGISMRRIGQLYMIQNGIIGLASTILALLLSHACLGLMGSFVASMGIVLDMYAVYPPEWAIMALVFVLSVLPTMARILTMSRKDSLNA